MKLFEGIPIGLLQMVSFFIFILVDSEPIIPN
jgi:hypothetical protein